MTSDLRSDANQPHYVYRFFDEARNALYVGCTNDAFTRLARHCNTRSWFPDVSHIEVDRYENLAAALEGERRWIQALAPLHNSVHHPESKSDGGWPARRARYAAEHERGITHHDVGCVECGKQLRSSKKAAPNRFAAKRQLLEHKRPSIRADVNTMLTAREGWRTISEHVRNTTGISVSHETLRRWYGKDAA